MRSALAPILATTLLLTCATASCAAGTSAGFDYPLHTADAKVHVGSREYAIWFHSTRPTIFVQLNAGAMFGSALATTLTLGMAQPGDPLPQPRAAARAILEDAGCALEEIYRVGNHSWEALYACPDGGVVSQAAVDAQRARWRAGLTTPDPLVAQ